MWIHIENWCSVHLPLNLKHVKDHKRNILVDFDEYYFDYFNHCPANGTKIWKISKENELHYYVVSYTI